MEQPGPYEAAEPGGPQIPGYGDVEEGSGLHRWYDVPASARSGGITWSRILQAWALVEVDLHEQYGVDLGDEQLLLDRSWAWLRYRIFALLSTESRLQRHFAPEPERG